MIFSCCVWLDDSTPLCTSQLTTPRGAANVTMATVAIAVAREGVHTATEFLTMVLCAGETFRRVELGERKLLGGRITLKTTFY